MVIKMPTVCEDEGGEAEVEDEAELLRRRAPELRVDAVLDDPHHEAGEAKEGEAGEPEAVERAHPDSVNGTVKSTLSILLALIVTSPTAMSAFPSLTWSTSISYDSELAL